MEPEKDQVGFFGILPASVRYDPELTFFERLLYVEITSLTKRDGYCWASNEFLGSMLDRSKSATSKAVANLEEQGHLRVDLLKNNQRRIYLTDPIHKQLGGYAKTARGVAENEQGGSRKLEHNKINNKINLKKEIKTTDAEAEKLAFDLFDSVKSNFPFTKSEPGKWAPDIQKLHRIDGYEYALIEAVLKWSQQDSFWKGNIRSAANLRKHFETLLVRIKVEQDKKQGNFINVDDEIAKEEAL
jgi:hypothetical protein